MVEYYSRNTDKLFSEFGFPLLKMFRFSYLDQAFEDATIDCFDLIIDVSIHTQTENFNDQFLDKTYKMMAKLLVRRVYNAFI